MFKRATRNVSFIFFTALALACAGCANQQAQQKEGAPSPVSAQVNAAEVRRITNRVADWQLAHMDNYHDYVPSFQERSAEARGWIQGTFLKGLADWAIATQQENYLRWLTDFAEKQQFQLGERLYHADDHVVGQYYLRLYEHWGKPAMLAPTREAFDAILLNPSTVDLEFTAKGTEKGYYKACLKRWCWADALFMSPPVWTKLSKLTGDPRYLRFSDQEFWATVDYLLDEETHLLLRDSRFFEKTEANGEKVFWSRGNGWVFSGLSDILDDLPAEHASRPRYEELYKRMANSLIEYQSAEGFWPVSLKAGELYPVWESSGTAFFVAGLAWGVTHDLLDAEAFMPAIHRGWAALSRAVNSEGMLGWVQQVGYAPGKVSENETQFYGAGAFLLAGEAMLGLLKSPYYQNHP